MTSKERIYLTNAGLTEIPQSLYEQSASLEFLDLSSNQLSDLPDSFEKFQNLKILFLTNNQFCHVPKVLARCKSLALLSFKSNKLPLIDEDELPTNLRWLILTDNQIKSLPRSMGKLGKLQKVALAGNQLTELPSEMAQCHNLELLRISLNCFEELPNWLLTMPRLAWLAYAGNPLVDNLGHGLDLPQINAGDLSLSEQIGKGQGGSGIVFRGNWLNLQGEKNQELAVKTFKSGVLSDGSPLDEMRAWSLAGQHPNLVPVLGRLVRHPQYSEALVFKLLSNQFKNLAATPSFESCTRDVYASDQKFSFAFVRNVLKGTADACRHLHHNGLMHGDLYAHNLMADPEGDVQLGDFGAASPCIPEFTTQLEQIEARAFGYLMQELLDRTISPTKDLPILRELQLQCLSELPHVRPKFEEIFELLERL